MFYGLNKIASFGLQPQVERQLLSLAGEFGSQALPCHAKSGL